MNERASARWRQDLFGAAAFLTRLPLGRPAPLPGALAQASWAFPVVGAAIGLWGGVAYGIALSLGLPTAAAALLAVLATALATGALHEDGLADTADGLGGGRDREQALAIMRDSRSGAFGVLALVFSVGLRAAALAVFVAAGPAIAALIAAHAGGRGLLPLVLRALEPARADGLGATAGRPEAGMAWSAAAIAAVVAVLALGLGRGLLALLLAGLAAALLASLARRRLGGYTGDVLGAIEQGGETAMLLVAAAWSP